MKKIIIILLTLLPFIVHAKENPERKYKDPFANMAIVDHFVWEAVKPFYNKDLKEVRSFSTIIKETTEQFKTPYGDEAFSYIIQFKGVLLKGFYIPTQKRFFITYLDIKTPTYKMPKSLSVGSKFNTIAKELKQEGLHQAKSVKYQGETEQVVFHEQNGKIIRIELFIYTG